MQAIRILIVGFGNVGQGFFELLTRVKGRLGLNVVVTEIIDRRRGHIINPKPSILNEAIQGRLLGDKVEVDEIPRLISESNADIMCEFTDLVVRSKGEPAFTYLATALRSGKHVITTNKGPIAFHYDELMELVGGMVSSLGLRAPSWLVRHPSTYSTYYLELTWSRSWAFSMVPQTSF